MAQSGEKGDVNAEEQQAQSAFIARLASYSVVNSTWNSVVSGYNAVKDYSPFVKAQLEKAEAASQKVYDVAAPVIGNLNEKYKLDEKGVQALEKGEKTVEGLKVAAADAKNKVVGVAVESKDMATGLIEKHPRPFNSLLDVTESIVNKILPPSLQDGNQPPKSDDAEAQKSVIARATNLGNNVSTRAVAKLRSINFRSPQEIAEMTHVVDLIQYASQFIDVEAQKTRIQNAVDASKSAIEQVKATTEAKFDAVVSGAKAAIETAQPVKKLIEDRTAEIKDGAQRTTVAVVASIAHSTEILRRKIGSGVSQLDVNGTRAQLQQRLTEVIERTKAYTDSLNEAQLKEYMTNVSVQSASALASLLNIINSSSSLRAQVTDHLLSWTNSLASRLGYIVVPISLQDTPSVGELIEEPSKSSSELELESEKSEKEAESAKSESM
jgi:hypothetical protein